MISEYLQHFCELSNGSLASFANEFSETYLKSLEKEVKVLLTRDGMKSLGDDISLEYFKQISDLVQLTFAKSNKEIFEVDEEVELKVNLKNI